MNVLSLEIRAIVGVIVLVIIALSSVAQARQNLPSTKSAQSKSAAAPRESGRTFTEPVLVKGSATNYGTNGFDISWVDSSTQKYYLADGVANSKP